MENNSEKNVQDILVEARHYKQLATKERERGRIRHAQEMEQYVKKLNQDAEKKGREENNAKLANENTTSQTV